MSKNLFLSILALSIFSCTSKTNCKQAVCTEILAMVTVEVTDTTNTTLAGISTETIMLSTGTILHTQLEASSFPPGSFTVADDSELKTLGYNSKNMVELHIIKDGKIVKAVSYTISADCCHVSKAEGPEKVSLN